MSDLGVTIAETMTAGRVGMVIGNSETESFAAQAAVVVGRMVAQGTADNQCANIAAAGDVTEDALGIVAYIPTDALDTADTYAIADMVTVVRRGYVWVTVEDAVAAGQTAFVRITADTGGAGSSARPVGGFRSDADTAEATEATYTRFRTSTSGAGLALVEINLP